MFLESVIAVKFNLLDLELKAFMPGLHHLHLPKTKHTEPEQSASAHSYPFNNFVLEYGILRKLGGVQHPLEHLLTSFSLEPIEFGFELDKPTTNFLRP